MTNEEKYKTPEVRKEAFLEFCDKKECDKCECSKQGKKDISLCEFVWLTLKANEELLPCPFCGGEACVVEYSETKRAYIHCKDCMAITQMYNTEAEAISAWNRRVK